MAGTDCGASGGAAAQTGRVQPRAGRAVDGDGAGAVRGGVSAAQTAVAATRTGTQGGSRVGEPAADATTVPNGPGV